jgi:hypothetical protein
MTKKLNRRCLTHPVFVPSNVGTNFNRKTKHFCKFLFFFKICYLPTYTQNRTSVEMFWNANGPQVACFLNSVWPDWANFRLMVNCLLWVVFWKLQKWPTFLVFFFPQFKLCINFDINVLGYILGDLLHKLVWSPWFFSCSRNTLNNREEKMKCKWNAFFQFSTCVCIRCDCTFWTEWPDEFMKKITQKEAQSIFCPKNIYPFMWKKWANISGYIHL